MGLDRKQKVKILKIEGRKMKWWRGKGLEKEGESAQAGEGRHPRLAVISASTLL